MLKEKVLMRATYQQGSGRGSGIPRLPAEPQTKAGTLYPASLGLGSRERFSLGVTVLQWELLFCRTTLMLVALQAEVQTRA